MCMLCIDEVAISSFLLMFFFWQKLLKIVLIMYSILKKKNIYIYIYKCELNVVFSYT